MAKRTMLSTIVWIIDAIDAIPQLEKTGGNLNEWDESTDEDTLLTIREVIRKMITM